MKRALITGITGQDGSYLAELLLEEGYEVFGLVRRSSTLNFERIAHIQDRLELISGDLTDQNSLFFALQQSDPGEVYNLAAQSFVQTSWPQPILTGDVTALGTTRPLLPEEIFPNTPVPPMPTCVFTPITLSNTSLKTNSDSVCDSVEILEASSSCAGVSVSLVSFLQPIMRMVVKSIIVIKRVSRNVFFITNY